MFLDMIDDSVSRVPIRYSEACPIMSNGDSRDRIVCHIHKHMLNSFPCPSLVAGLILFGFTLKNASATCAISDVVVTLALNEEVT